MRLGYDFFERDTKIVAQELLGKVFVSRNKELVITETESYLGPEDLASHARFGPTATKKIMWEPGGTVYVYLIYGMHEMTNIVTGDRGRPGAVLLRSGYIQDLNEAIIGPGKFSKYLGISRNALGENLAESPTLSVEDCGIIPGKILQTPRIGIDYAGPWAKKKLRFVMV